MSRTESERAIDLAYKAVARRDLTVAELRTRLERKHVPPEAIDDAVAELQETGFLDDARYARQFAEDKREIDQWGTDRIAMDLRRRGIAPQLIDAALVTHDRDSEMRTALLLLRRRYPHGAPGRPRARPRLADAGPPRLLARSLLRRDPHLGAHRARTPPRGVVADSGPAALVSWTSGRRCRRETKKTSKSPDFVLYLN